VLPCKKSVRGQIAMKAADKIILSLSAISISFLDDIHFQGKKKTA
jgi:hypothetical protein